MKTITVKGTAKLAQAPDNVKVLLTLHSAAMQYDAAVERGAERLELLYSAAEKALFDRKDLITDSFAVQTRYDNRRDDSGNYNRVFAGYEIVQQTSLSFEWNSEKLSALLNAIAASGAEPEMEIVFGLCDEHSAELQALALAVQDAKDKAAVLATAGGVKLADIVAIDYGSTDRAVSPTRYDGVQACMSLARNVQINPADVDVRGTVTVVWEIDSKKVY